MTYYEELGRSNYKLSTSPPLSYLDLIKLSNNFALKMLCYSVVLFVAAFATAATATATKPPPVTVTVTVACESTPVPTVDLGYGRYAATVNVRFFILSCYVKCVV